MTACAQNRVLLAPVIGEHRAEMTLPTGMTLADIVAAALPGLPQSAHVRVRVTLVTASGSMLVPSTNWMHVRPKPGVQVLVQLVPGRDALRSVLSILVTVAAFALGQFWLGPWVATTFGISSQLASAAVSLGVTLVGNFLINKFLPAQTADQRREKPVYAISGWRNEYRPDGAVPLILGRHRTAPPYGAMTWTEIVGDEMYLRALFVVGYGPLRLSEPKIGETLLSEYEDVEIELREGRPDDPPVSLYPNQVIETPEGAELTRPLPRDNAGEVVDGPSIETPVIRVSAADSAEMAIIIGFPAGLISFDKKSRPHGITVSIRIRQRPVGAVAWQDVTTLDIWAARREALYRYHRWTLPARGRWEIEITRMTSERTSAQESDRTTLVAIQSIRPEYPLNFDRPLALAAVRVKATHQLNGTLDRFNVIASMIAPDWDAEAGQWVERETRNPAAAYRRVLQGPATRFASPDNGVDLANLADWSEFCRAKGLKYDRIHDFEASLLEGLAEVATAGRASPRHDGRRWGVIIDRPGGIVVDHINPRNSRGFRWRRPYFDPPHAWRVPFIDASNSFQSGEMLVPWPGYEGEIITTEERPLPGKTDPAEIWIETRRAQYAAIHRPDVITAIQDGPARVATRGDLVMGSWDTLDRTMCVARVIGVRERHVELDAPVAMTAGESYAVRWRIFSVEDTIGESIVRPVQTIPGEHRSVVLGGHGEVPAVGTIVHFGHAASDSLPLIVAGIEPGQDMASVLHMQAHVPLIDELTDAEVPPPWDGRVGYVLPLSTTRPQAPVFTSILSGAEGTGDPNGLQLALRAASGIPVGSFVIEHRLADASAWLSVTIPVAAGGATIPGYLSGQTVDLRAYAVSLNGIAGDLTSTIPVSIGAGDIALPTALPEDSIQLVAKPGHVEIVFATGPDEATVAVQIWRDGQKLGTPIPVSPSGTFGRIDGDSTRANILSETEWTLGAGWAENSGELEKTPGTASAAEVSASVSPGTVYRIGVSIRDRSAGALTIATRGGAAAAGDPATGNGLAFARLTALAGNDGFAFEADADFDGTISAMLAYAETAACVSQGVHSYQLEPLNEDEIAGPRSALRTVTVI